MIRYFMFFDHPEPYSRRRAFEWWPFVVAAEFRQVVDTEKYGEPAADEWEDIPGQLYLMEREHGSDAWDPPAFEGELTLAEATDRAAEKGCPHRKPIDE